MGILKKIAITFCFTFLSIYSTIYAQIIHLGKVTKALYITDNQYIYKDLSRKINIDSIAKLAKFKKISNAIPNFDWSQNRGWVRLAVKSSILQELTMQVQNPIFKELDFFIFEGKTLVFQYNEIAQTRLPQVNFVYQPQLNYTIYIAGKSSLNPLKFPIAIIPTAKLERVEAIKMGKTGFIIGLLTMLMLLNVLAYLYFKVRLFGFLAINGFSFTLLYLYLNGYLFQMLGRTVFDLQYFNVGYAIYFFYLIINLIFPWQLFKLKVLQDKKWRNSYLIILCWSIFLGMLYIFFQKRLTNLSENNLTNMIYLLRLTVLVGQIFIISLSIKLLKIVKLAKWFLIAILPPILSFIIPRFLPNLIANQWLTQSELMIWVLFWYILLMSIGFALYLSSNYTVNKIEVETSLSQQPEPPIATIKNISQQEIPYLSKRETEILQAYANGFSYQEISDAFFISPHTVRTHIKNIYQKMGINSKAEAVRWVLEQK